MDVCYTFIIPQGRGAVDIVTDSLKIDMTISNQSDCRGKTEDACDGSDVQKKTSDMTQKVCARSGLPWPLSQERHDTTAAVVMALHSRVMAYNCR